MKNKPSNKKKSAFSLIELSIVLIIIGLLVAGVTGGASLIKSSELRSVITEARSWSIAVNGFYNQFNALPGDFGTVLGSSSVGDGDGTIEFATGPGTIANGTYYEGRNAWIQLKAAGILDSNVLSLATAIVASNTAVSSFGANLPASKIRSSGWDFEYNSSTSQNTVVLTGAIGTTCSVGSATAGTSLTSATSCASGAITPTDALSLDSKFDDGSATNGKLRGIRTTCFNSTTGAYATSLSSKDCAISYQIDVNS